MRKTERAGSDDRSMEGTVETGKPAKRKRDHSWQRGEPLAVEKLEIAHTASYLPMKPSRFYPEVIAAFYRRYVFVPFHSAVAHLYRPVEPYLSRIALPEETALALSNFKDETDSYTQAHRRMMAFHAEGKILILACIRFIRAPLHSWPPRTFIDYHEINRKRAERLHLLLSLALGTIGARAYIQEEGARFEGTPKQKYELLERVILLGDDLEALRKKALNAMLAPRYTVGDEHVKSFVATFWQSELLNTRHFAEILQSHHQRTSMLGKGRLRLMI